MRLSLAAGPLAPQASVALEIQSISDSGLAVLTAARAEGVDRDALGNVPEGETLTFELEKDGQRMTLQANLVWVDWSSGHGAGPRLELIVDTGDQPGWTALAGAGAAE